MPRLLPPTLIVTLALLIACSAPQPPATLPPPTLSVDPSLTPPVTELPGFEAGETRPVAALTGPDGTVASFVANELWLASDDPAELDAFLDRWRGEVLQTFDPVDYGLSGIEPQYLIRIDASAADPAALADDLRRLDPTASGDHRVSSRTGLELIAAGAGEAAGGARVGVNWIGGGDQFRDRSALEAPSGSSLGGVAYDPNAFAWPSHDVGSPQDIGVAEAWRALELAGRLSNRVELAILDMGFDPDADTPAGFLAISNVPFVNPLGTENLIGCGGGSDCPWHGANVLSAAMAVPDNRFGSAGPAGPVGDAVIVFTSYDFFTSITALGAARVAGARIANMSYSAPVPDYVAWSVLPFEAATAAFRASGMLLFAAAGNDGKDVDAERCFLVCWEKTWYTPCENAGVICVGGVSGNATSKAGGSNFGAEQVDIFAPYTLWLGPDPDSPANQVQVKNGTSFASPFTAGVAALIWAADPSLSAGEVEDLLFDTARPSSDDRVDRIVNALGAVQAALGNIPPAISLFGHDDGDRFTAPLNLPLNLSASVEDFEDGRNCCELSWVSSVDGDLGTGTAIQPTFTTVGPRVLTLSTQDSGGARSTLSVTLDVVNRAPEVEISKPADGDEAFRDVPLILRATSFDLNEPDARLACDRLVWTSSLPSDPFPLSGCEVEVVFASNGPRTLTLTGTDPQGASATAAVALSVVDPPPDLPPFVRITRPENDADVSPDDLLALEGTATDPEGDTDLAFAWTARLDGGTPVDIGDGPSDAWRPEDSFDFRGEGSYRIEIRLTVRDGAGNTGSDFVVLEFVVIN